MSIITEEVIENYTTKFVHDVMQIVSKSYSILASLAKCGVYRFLFMGTVLCLERK